jgi:hypothetical protein
MVIKSKTAKAQSKSIRDKPIVSVSHYLVVSPTFIGALFSKMNQEPTLSSVTKGRENI